MRDCENCKHRVMKVGVGKGTSPEHFWGCECCECEFEPTAKDNLGVDCISRKAVLEITAETGALETQNRVKALPSVTPRIEPRKGHWIWVVDETPSTPISPYELDYAGWVCSCCREIPDDICEWDNPDEPPTYKFCPNCGADMQESEVEE